ncbi:MAG: alpha/beta hydrolase [Tannerellaceae bacterium]|nr:alpha/beta hydrolase [Tannerellaceae bacterium]
MRKQTLAILACFVCLYTFGQEIAGDWNGVLKVQQIELRLVLHISPAEGGYSATMDSPDQGAKGIPVTSISFENPTLKFSVAALGVQYEGVLGADGIITGTFKQGGITLPLSLSRGNGGEEARRPQEPAKPYPYYEEDVYFDNAGAGVRLAGTLTLPEREGLFPAVVLISGSGPQDRNEELLNHKPFLVIADHLTRNGIAVLRFDDRGTAASTGTFESATSYDFSEDAAAAVAYLKTRKEINHGKIGLIGHSEGAIIAPMLASRSGDIAFIVLLAGSGVRGDKLLLAQQELINRALGMSEAAIEENRIFHTKAFGIVTEAVTQEQMTADLSDYFRQLMEAASGGNVDDSLVLKEVEKVTKPWVQYLLKHDPSVDLEKVKCPVLALNGEKDLQVPAGMNLEAIRKALAKGNNNRSTIKELPGLNHLFQECETGVMTEYGRIEQTFSPTVLDLMAQWVNEQARR